MSEENDIPEGDDPGYVPEQQTGEPATEPQADAPPTVEDIASRMGWSPQDKWKGDPDKWKPAHEFLENTADINTKLSSRLKGLEDTVSNINRTNEVMNERALANMRQQILAERDEAFDTGDKEAFKEAERKLGELPQMVPQASPHVQQFSERNANWFQKDQEATRWAVNRAQQLAEQGLSEQRQLATVEREVGQYFPEYAPKPKPKSADLTPPGNRGGTKRGHTFNDLPAEAQKEALYWEGKGIKREDYVKSYFEQEGV